MTIARKRSSYSAAIIRKAALAGVKLLSWKPEMRYREPHITTSVANDWLAVANSVYEKAIGGLTLAGLI